MDRRSPRNQAIADHTVREIRLLGALTYSSSVRMTLSAQQADPQEGVINNMSGSKSEAAQCKKEVLPFETSIIVTTFAKMTKAEHLALPLSTAIFDSLTQRGVIQNIRASQIGPYDAATLESVGNLDQYALCPIGDMFKVTFCLPNAFCQLGRHTQLPPMRMAPVRFHMGNTEVQVDSFYWHAESQEVLCLRCQEVVSDATRFSRNDDDALKLCSCRDPKDLLELYSNAKSRNTAAIFAQECLDAPGMTDTHVLLRVPRHRADRTENNEWCKQLPLSSFDGVQGKFKPMLIRIKVIPADANTEPVVLTGFVRLCGKNAGLQDRHHLQAAFDAKLKRNRDTEPPRASRVSSSISSKPSSTSRDKRRAIETREEHKHHTKYLAFPHNECDSELCIDQKHQESSFGSVISKNVIIDGPQPLLSIQEYSREDYAHEDASSSVADALGQLNYWAIAAHRSSVYSLYPVLRGASGIVGGKTVYFSSVLEDATSMPHAPNVYQSLCLLPLVSAGGSRTNSSANIPVDFCSLHDKIRLGYYTTLAAMVSDTKAFLLRVTKMLPVQCDEAHAARALLRVLESAGPPMAARRKRRRKKSALRIVAPTKNVGGNDAWLVQSSAAASNTGIHGRKKTDEPELTLREQHVSLSEVTGKVYTCCATSVNTVADTSCHAHVTAHTTDAEPVLDTAKADGVNDKKCVGEHFPGQTFSTCGRRYYTPHHGDTLAKIAAVFGINVGVLVKHNTNIAAVGPYAPLQKSTPVLLLPICTLTHGLEFYRLWDDDRGAEVKNGVEQLVGDSFGRDNGEIQCADHRTTSLEPRALCATNSVHEKRTMLAMKPPPRDAAELDTAVVDFQLDGPIVACT